MMRVSLGLALFVGAAGRTDDRNDDDLLPTSKKFVKEMDALISAHTAWNNYVEWSEAQKPFWMDDFVYDTVEGFPMGANYTALRGWYDGEHIPFNNAFWPIQFNQMIFLGDNMSATTTTYANAKWKQGLGKLLPPPGKHDVVVRILDFYKFAHTKDNTHGVKISYNWMMIDMVGLLLQVGQRALPKPQVLEEGIWVQPPKALDGTPAPNSFFVNDIDTESSRRTVTSMLQYEWIDQKGAAPEWAPDMTWYGPVGIGLARNKADYEEQFVQKYYKAFANIVLQIDVLPCEGHFCGAHGYIYGDHVGEWLGQAPTGKRVHMRFGSHWHVRNGVIKEAWTIIDLPALFLQFGVDLFTRNLETSNQLVEAPKQNWNWVEFNNNCMTTKDLSPPTKFAPQEFLKDCPAWVIKTTDAVWHALENVNESIDKYFYEDWQSYSDAGKMRGLPALKDMVAKKRAAFPDLQIHVTDAMCHGNDIDGYKTVMPDIITGTNLGPSEFGPATNKKIIYRGLAVCYVQKVAGEWQYIGEYVLHDSASMALQMGHQPRMAVPPVLHDCELDSNYPSWGWEAPPWFETLFA